MKQILLSVTLAALAGSVIAAPSFSGKWTSAGQPCNDPDGTNQVTIRGKMLQWYEQRCEVSNARNLGSSTRYDAKCSGEGQTWRDVLTLSLSSGKLRIHRKSDGRIDTYLRCSSPGGTTSRSSNTTTQLDFVPATSQQRGILVSVLGDDFVKGNGGGGSPELLVSKVDLNNDNKTDLVVFQRAFCTNHACEYHFLLNESGKWKDIGIIESWAYPYIIRQPRGRMSDIVIFDHITNDCLACSPPKPVKYIWKQKKGTAMAGKFLRVGPVSEKKFSN